MVYLFDITGVVSTIRHEMSLPEVLLGYLADAADTQTRRALLLTSPAFRRALVNKFWLSDTLYVDVTATSALQQSPVTHNAMALVVRNSTIRGSHNECYLYTPLGRWNDDGWEFLKTSLETPPIWHVFCGWHNMTHSRLSHLMSFELRDLTFVLPDTTELHAAPGRDGSHHQFDSSGCAPTFPVMDRKMMTSCYRYLHQLDEIKAIEPRHPENLYALVTLWRYRKVVKDSEELFTRQVPLGTPFSWAFYQAVTAEVPARPAKKSSQIRRLSQLYLLTWSE